MDMASRPLQCDGFVATARYDGYVYGTTYYVVSAVVTSLAEAQSRLVAIREAIQRDHPTWRTASDDVRLASSDWRGNPVRIELSYSMDESEPT